MITECKPKNDIKFDIYIMQRGMDGQTGKEYYEPKKILPDICGQDLADIVESATKEPGVEIHIQRAIPIKFRSTRWRANESLIYSRAVRLCDGRYHGQRQIGADREAEDRPDEIHLAGIQDADPEPGVHNKDNGGGRRWSERT